MLKIEMLDTVMSGTVSVQTDTNHFHLGKDLRLLMAPHDTVERSL